MKEAVKPGVLPILHSLSFLLWSALSGRSLQYDPHQTEEPPCQAHCLVRKNGSVRSSADISDPCKNGAETEYAHEKGPHGDHQQSADNTQEKRLCAQPQ